MTKICSGRKVGGKTGLVALQTTTYDRRRGYASRLFLRHQNCVTRAMDHIALGVLDTVELPYCAAVSTEVAVVYGYMGMTET